MNNLHLYRTVPVEASKHYDVLVGKGLLKELGSYLHTVLDQPCKLAIISDSNVWPIYGQTVVDSAAGCGFEMVHYTIAAGESSKNFRTCYDILNFLSENRLSRRDAVIALGGGVVGDIAGFAASVYMRGIPYVQIPTTLLAMVDSAVGGKTAIDLPSGKNHVGTFSQPSLVVCDVNTLETLPEPVFLDGCAEVVKYGVVFDADLFEHLTIYGPAFDRAMVIPRCIELKRDVVEADEFDTGVRQKLNFGHTVGHAIEALSDYTVTHGQAVAVGMAIIAKAGCKSVYPQLADVLKTFGLPISTDYCAKELLKSVLADKKRFGNTVNLVIPAAIGSCEIVATPIDALESFLEEGL